MEPSVTVENLDSNNLVKSPALTGVLNDHLGSGRIVLRDWRRTRVPKLVYFHA